MSKQVKTAVASCLLAVVAGGVGWYFWKQGEPRRQALRSLQALDRALSADAESVPGHVVLPSTLASRTVAEQTEFLTKTLRDEISADGLVALQKQGTYGPLKTVFPAEGERWAQMAGVSVADCVAFRAEKNGLRAEVVLVKEGETYRVVRCNNVKQLAM